MSIKHLVKNRKNVNETPQSEQAPGTVANNAGGYAFALDDWKRLDRFLILGSEGGTYYVSEKRLTKQNAACVERCFQADPERTAGRIAAISSGGLAPSNDPAIFALAVGVGMKGAARRASLSVLPAVCRIGTHLFHFMAFAKGAGSGRSVQRALQDWYLKRPLERLAEQLVKYQSRDGWSHRDVLRLAKPKPATEGQNSAFRWVTKGDEAYNDSRAVFPGDSLKMIDAFIAIKNVKHVPTIVKTITDARLPRECVPTEAMEHPEVWEALLPHMGMTAMLRNLGNMSKVGLLKPLSDASKTISARLVDQEQIRRSRVHPFGVLLALKTYGQGHGFRGKGTWTPVPKVMGALDQAFYLAFKNVRPTGKRILMGLDVSASMGSSMGNSPITCAEGTAAMAMVTARTEEDYFIHGFAGDFRDLKISEKDTIESACAKTYGGTFGGTDCALPMTYATAQDLKVDAFIVYTDNETWAGHIHPFQALKKYRQKSGIPAKLVVVGMVATEFSIADPSDAGMLDVVGFDASAPAVLSDFIADREPQPVEDRG